MAEIFWDGKKAEYPWQLEQPPWSPKAEMTEAERRADFARSQFDFWKSLLDEDLFDHPELFYDEGSASRTGASPSRGSMRTGWR